MGHEDEAAAVVAAHVELANHLLDAAADDGRRGDPPVDGHRRAEERDEEEEAAGEERMAKAGGEEWLTGVGGLVDEHLKGAGQREQGDQREEEAPPTGGRLQFADQLCQASFEGAQVCKRRRRRRSLDQFWIGDERLRFEKSRFSYLFGDASQRTVCPCVFCVVYHGRKSWVIITIVTVTTTASRNRYLPSQILCSSVIRCSSEEVEVKEEDPGITGKCWRCCRSPSRFAELVGLAWVTAEKAAWSAAVSQRYSKLLLATSPADCLLVAESPWPERKGCASSSRSSGSDSELSMSSPLRPFPLRMAPLPLLPLRPPLDRRCCWLIK